MYIKLHSVKDHYKALTSSELAPVLRLFLLVFAV